MKATSLLDTILHPASLTYDARQEMIRYLYAHARLTIWGLIGTTMLLGLSLTHYLPFRVVALWWGIALLVEGYRLYIIRRFAPESYQAEEWVAAHRRFSGSALLNAFVFGLVFYYIFPLEKLDVDTSGIQAFLFVALLGVAGTGISTLSADVRLAIRYLLLIASSLAIVLLMHGGLFNLAILLLSGVYLAIQFYTSTTYNRIWLREYNQKHPLLQSELRVKQLSLHDPMTSLRNRRGMELDMETLFSRIMDNDIHLVCYCLNLENFRSVNTTFSHAVGDAVLVEIANRILHHLDVDHHAYRIGGDSFWIIRTFKIADEHLLRQQAKQFGTALHSLFDSPVILDTIQVPLRCYMAIVTAPKGEENCIERISHYADMTLHHAKRTHADKPVLYVPEFDEALEKLLR